MKKKLGVLLVMIVGLLVIAAPVDAKKPVEGEMKLYFNLGFAPEVQPPESDPCTAVTWAGTIEFDHGTYPIAFFPTSSRETGKAFHFEEVWKVYDEGAFVYGARGELEFCPSDDDVVMWGHDAGVTSPNDTYRGNGRVEYATPDSPFEMLEGRRTHMSGVVTFSEVVPGVPETLAPETAPGTLRIN